jgi:hypothetical protein
MKDNWIKELEAAAEKFWKTEYPLKSFEQRCEYWRDNMEKGMREQAKLGLPPFSVFNKAWYQSVKEQEPEIDEILDALFLNQWKEMEKSAFYNAIDAEEDTEDEKQ